MFQIEALPSDPFAPYFAMDEDALRARRARVMTVEESPGTPCRVSLADAEVGDTVILVNYAHQTGDSPYSASHAIYVREGVAQARPAPGEVPAVLRRRTISLRCFDSDHMIRRASLVEGLDLEYALTSAMDDPEVAYAHLHYAAPGCFAASVRRAG